MKGYTQFKDQTTEATNSNGWVMTKFQAKTRKSNYDIMREQHLFEKKRQYLRELFYKLDTNGDRVVSKDEIVRYLVGSLQMD